MNEKFFELKKQKQDAMINASLYIFSRNCYQHASTDEIVKRAGISKGLLFHYFGSKKKLYEFLYDYSARYIGLELYSTISVKEGNCFEIVKQIELAHYHVAKCYPDMIAFVRMVAKETDQDCKENLKEIEEKLAESYQKIQERMEEESLLEKEKLAEVLQLTTYINAGINEYSKMLSSQMTAKEIYDEKIKYFTLLQRFY